MESSARVPRGASASWASSDAARALQGVMARGGWRGLAADVLVGRRTGAVTDVPPDAAQGEVPALGGPMAMGPGMALIEQRLRRVEGDPTLLINNQFKLEEMRLMQGARGPLRESRPW